MYKQQFVMVFVFLSMVAIVCAGDEMLINFTTEYSGEDIIINEIETDSFVLLNDVSMSIMSIEEPGNIYTITLIDVIESTGFVADDNRTMKLCQDGSHVYSNEECPAEDPIIAVEKDADKGHGNDADGYDEDNPGKSKGNRKKKHK